MIKNFILYKNPQLISKEDFKKHLRSELERVKLWILKVKEFCNENSQKYGIELKYNEEYKSYNLEYIDKENKNNNKNDSIFNKKFEEILKKNGYEKYEILDSENIIETINSYIKDISK